MKIKINTSSSNEQPGYVFVLFLMLMTLSIALSTQIYNENIAHVLVARTMVDRQRATTLANGGVQLAMSSLLTTDTGETKQNPSAQAKAKQGPSVQVASGKKLLEKILPVLNRWQTFKLSPQVDGIDATLNICIMCEDGKFNPNWFFIMQELKRTTGQESGYAQIKKEFEQRLRDAVGFDVTAVLDKFFTERKAPLIDITELLELKEFAVFKNKLFYEPPTSEQKGKGTVYLLDLFTTEDWLGPNLKMREQVNPWLFSDAWCIIFGLQRPKAGDIKERKDQVTGWLKDFKDKTNWPQDWDKLLKPIYHKDFASLPKNIDMLFSTNVAPTLFSVLSYATVGSITQRLYAVFQLTGKPEEPFVIKKMYWL